MMKMSDTSFYIKLIYFHFYYRLMQMQQKLKSQKRLNLKTRLTMLNYA